MTNHAALLRSLLIYGICLPLAVFLGYILTNPDDLFSLGVIGVILVILIVPILLRFHYALLLISWNTTMVLFFLPGRPSLFLAMSAISFFICIGHRTLDKRFRFLSVPDVTRPLVALFLVILFTAEATGGIGIRAMGSNVYGGQRYILLFVTIFGYFALASKRIPVEKAHLCIALFFLAGMTNFLQDWYSYSGPLTRYLYLVFPPTNLGETEMGVSRLGGLSTGSAMVFCYMLARYGIKGIFSVERPWRCVLFILFSGIGLLGGYRSALIVLIMCFIFQFFLEGVHRTKLLAIFLFISVSVMAVSVPLMQRMPITIQRSFAFIPFLPIDPSARASAETSSKWRIGMWKAAIQEIPQYLLIGKGFGFSAQDFNAANDATFKSAAGEEEWWGSLAAGDYHNGPLSVIITFGIWGTLAFLWLLVGGFRVLLNNYRYGEERLKIANTFLLAYYLARVISFLFVVGGFAGDLPMFLGLVGLGAGLNGGMVRAPKTVPTPVEKTDGLAHLLPRPKSAFSR